jgi:hypothetical protein
MVSRAVAGVGESALSVTFARRAFDGAGEFDPPDWLAASTAEGLARAYAAQGSEWYDRAQRPIAAIADDESREVVSSPLASVPRKSSPL